MRCTSGGSETQGWPTLIAGDGSTHHPRPDGHLELRDVDVEVLREQLLQDSVQEALEHLASTENATASYTTLAVGVLCGGARGDDSRAMPGLRIQRLRRVRRGWSAVPLPRQQLRRRVV